MRYISFIFILLFPHFIDARELNISDSSPLENPWIGHKRIRPASFQPIPFNFNEGLLFAGFSASPGGSVRADLSDRGKPHTFSSGFNYFSYAEKGTNGLTKQTSIAGAEVLYGIQNPEDSTMIQYPKSTMYVELNFLVLLIAIRVNFEFLIKEHPSALSYLRIGIGGMAAGTTSGTVIPISYHVLFDKGSKGHFELGIGLLIYRMQEREDYMRQTITSKSTIPLPDITLGYRSQHPTGGAVFKIGLFPFPSLGLAVGGAF